VNGRPFPEAPVFGSVTAAAVPAVCAVTVVDDTAAAVTTGAHAGTGVAPGNNAILPATLSASAPGPPR
jgi:hypothetical protein